MGDLRDAPGDTRMAQAMNEGEFHGGFYKRGF